MSEVERPRLIVVAGPNGTGKTSITEQLLRHEWMGGCVYINPDFIARDEFGDWNALDAVLKAAAHGAESREQCPKNRQSFAFETVLSMPDKVEFIRRARRAGSSLGCSLWARMIRPSRQACCNARDGGQTRRAHQQDHCPLHPFARQLLGRGKAGRPRVCLRQFHRE